MTVSAHDVAAVLRARLPGLPVKKLHKLLYYCQGWIEETRRTVRCDSFATLNLPL